MMKVNDFLKQAKLALNSHTVYGSGAFGAPISDYPSQLSRYYNNTKDRCGQAYADKLKAEAAKAPCWTFDCCGLIKAIIWGWDAKRAPNNVYGGAIYESNGLPDYGADSGKGNLIYYCTDVSEDFSKIVPGEMLWLEGHVGIYVGDGKAIECTTGWTDNVLTSVVTNIRAAKSGERGRKWTKHGKLSKWVDYSTTPTKKEYAVEIDGFDNIADARQMELALAILGTKSQVVEKSK